MDPKDDLHFRIKIAEKVVDVSASLPSTKAFCRDYLTDEPADFAVAVTKEDLAREREYSRKTRREELGTDTPAPKWELDTLSLYRKIAESMPAYHTMLMHGSAVAVDGEAYFFIAKSGTGKSTHTRLWRGMLADRAVMVNDDKPLVLLRDGRAYVCGTPWMGKHRLGSPIIVPLSAVCILQRGEENTICRIEKAQAYPNLLQQTYRPMQKESLEMTLSLLDDLAASVSLYRLSCNMDPYAARLSYETMSAKA